MRIKRTRRPVVRPKPKPRPKLKPKAPVKKAIYPIGGPSNFVLKPRPTSPKPAAKPKPKVRRKPKVRKATTRRRRVY